MRTFLFLCNNILLILPNFLAIGDAGRHNDGGVLANSDFGQAMEAGALLIPDDRPLPGKSHADTVGSGLIIWCESLILSGTTMPSPPYVIVGDVAFPLKKNMMRPFPGRNLCERKAIFNH